MYIEQTTEAASFSVFTCKNLMMLLAPNTRWAVVNLAGSVGGK